MKRSLFALLMIGVLLCACACSITPSSKTTEPALNNSTGSTTMSPTEAPTTDSTTQPTTEAPTEATTEAPTEPSTEPTTEAPTKPTDAPKPTEPTKPTEAPDPTEPTEPVTTTPALTGWVVDREGKRYYYDEDGSLHTGWLKLNDTRYYFHEDGSMAIGKVEVPGSGTRYFSSTGKEVTLVNPWNYVPDDYTVKLASYKGYEVAKICLEDLKAMIADCKSYSGSKAVVVSAYRTHAYQVALHERRIQRFLDQGYSMEDAKREAARRVAVGGTSEHELGLALDIVDVSYQTLDRKQEETVAQQWLMVNSWKYGFILRYPNEKSDITGIIYEPWHYRYVGKELAKEIYDSGLCLEEYFEQLS